MYEKTLFGIDPESTVDSAINGEVVPDNSEDTEKKEAPTAPIEEGEQQVGNGSNDEQSAESNAPVSEPAEAPTFPKQDDVTAGEMKAEIEKIRHDIAESVEASKKTFAELREIHKLYHNEFAGRLKSMQDELDAYHKADRGHAFDSILSAIARIYGNNETLVDEIADPKTKKHVKYMLLDILDLLEEYGVQRLKSNPGDKRNPRHCQVLERIPTDDPTLHDTIVASHNSGFYMENRTIIKEMVDIYLYECPTTPEYKEEAAPVCDATTTTEQENENLGGN